MEDKILKINHWVFKWYYQRVPEHFRQYTLLKSVSLLIQNYKHNYDWTVTQGKTIGDLMKKNDDLHSQVQKLEWKLAGHDDITTMRLNGMFGTDMPTSQDN